ncbi:ABC-F family ATP-binding cassette domain-containing protein [Desulfobotulus sp. H1]|uniref:ABC-F family ATP-binding cassette domain-containing protein n=1 Tax=Desulfobotulus pelophilus TaxID=2823377 RepID=A0ABT3N9I5_9BACT|nr:ABC-F family ATP-binding cassette domain-containing protein [Desulfobotulus pelophilus]MCW7754109.1 ABC-F family ATP-binding cassette domain-containing protein [Desulfobotulus pelophilus]
MAALLTWKGLSKTYGEQLLFEDLQIAVEEGEALGLIGPNGSGKSTLLSIMGGLVSPDRGDRLMRKGLKVAFLSQDDSFTENHTVRRVLEEAAAAGPEDPEAYGRIRRIMGEAGFPDLDAEVGTLSGGWRKRLAIVRELVRLPELLLLDEPTNHLDVEGILWLEDRLKTADFTFISVSHDRRFLDRVCRRIMELGRYYPDGFFSVMGGYERFTEQRELFLQQQEEREARLQNRMRRETEWLRRMPKARTTKAQYRIDAAARLEDELSSVRFRNRQQTRVEIGFDTTQRKSRKLVEVMDLGGRVEGRELFSHISLVLAPGMRLGLAGKNGAGKSTFMRMLAGELRPDSGEVRWAEGLSVVYFDQSRENLDPDISLKQALCPDGDSVMYQGRNFHVASWAAKFLFKADQLYQPVGKLSGGEKARILLANLVRRPADVLLLDEPTNDLDIPSLEVLEDSLQEFPGAVVLVSHDRYLMDRVCQRVLGFDGKGNTGLFATMDQWLADIRLSEKPKEKKTGNQTPKKEKKKSGKLSYKLQLELDGMEQRILEAEARLEDCNHRMGADEVLADGNALQFLCGELEEAGREVEALYARWEELEQLREEAER